MNLERIEFPTLKINEFDPKVDWDVFKVEFMDCIARTRIKKLQKILAKTGGVFGTSDNDFDRIHHLDNCFILLDDLMEKISSQVLMIGLKDTSIKCLLLDDQWRNISFQEKMQRLDCFFVKLFSEIGLEDRPQESNSRICLDLIEFEEEKTVKHNLASVIFDLQLDYSFDYKSMIFESKAYSKIQRSKAIKIQKHPSYPDIVKEIHKCLSDDMKVVLMGPRIYGTTDENAILDVGLGIADKEYVDILLSKSESFFAADCHNYKVMAKFQAKSSSVYCYLWRDWPAQLMKNFFTTEFLKYWFTCQPESQKLYLYLHKWFVEGLKWRDFADKTLISMIMIYFIAKKMLPPIKDFYKSYAALKKFNVEWNGFSVEYDSLSDVITNFAAEKIIAKLGDLHKFKDYLVDFFDFFTKQYPLNVYEFNCFNGKIQKRTNSDHDCFLLVYGYNDGYIFTRNLPTLMQFLEMSKVVMSHVV